MIHFLIWMKDGLISGMEYHSFLSLVSLPPDSGLGVTWPLESGEVPALCAAAI
jgi:hypothetical protein